MESKAEFIASWNELCADCKMIESDLTNPTEPWLTKVLVSYLRMLGYRIAMEEADKRDRRFLIKLVRYIDHIYKITDKTFAFTYYDLLRPKATDRLKERQELEEKIQNTFDENERLKHRAENIQEEADSLSKEVPILRKELTSINAQLNQRKEQLQQTQDAIKDLKIKIDEHKTQVRNLKKQIVPNEEAQELQMQLSNVQENCIECEEKIRHIESNLKSHISDNDKILEVLKAIEIVKDILTADFVEEFNEAVKKLNNMHKQIAKCEKEKEQMIQLIERNQKAVKTMKERLKIEESQYNEGKEKRQQTIMQRTKECDVLLKKLTTLRDDIIAIESLIIEQKDIKSFILEHVATIMENYK